MNLITNASDAIGERIGKIRIRTGVVNLEAGDLLDAQPQPLPPGEYISLEVVDDGHGMDEPTIKRIFEPFYSTRFAGRGLGLASVLGILKQHRGAVRVKSVVGVGTSMQILLPVYREVRAIASEDPSRTATPAPPPRASIGTILVVDDEPQVRELLDRVLSAQGYRVLTACDGEEALRVVEHQVGTIDLVLLDLVMPRLSGELVLATLRSYYKQLPVIVMSGHTERETLQNVGRNANASYLGKPFKLAVLLDAVRREVLRT
jgi:CheY-like chemotaxis protein